MNNVTKCRCMDNCAHKKAVAEMPKYCIVADEKVVMCWKCDECDETHEITPNNLAESGIPFCGDCDTDMIYLHTKVLK